MSLKFLDPSFADGPIPGENQTSDERNYPWHRPPDFTNTDEALDHILEKLVDTREGFMYMNLIELDVSIAACVDMLVTQGISDGRWTPDFAIILAGPIARLFTIMAKSFELDYELGVDNPSDMGMTAAGAKEEMALASKSIKRQIEGIKESVEEAPLEEPEEGLMSAVSEQDTMLGYAGPTDDGEEIVNG